MSRSARAVGNWFNQLASTNLMGPRTIFNKLASISPGRDPTTAVIEGQWFTDNGGIDILINGLSTTQSNPCQFTTWMHVSPKPAPRRRDRPNTRIVRRQMPYARASH